MIKWSIIAGILGILASRVATILFGLRTPHPRPDHYWLFGLASLFPGWLISFLGLLGNSVGGASEASLPRPVILSSSAALLGIICSDFLLRRFQRSGRSYPALTYWLLGASSLLPAWCIALLSPGGN